MTETVKIHANSTFQKIAEGPTNIVFNPVTGVTDLVITAGSAPDVNFANTFPLKSGVVDGATNPISVASGSSVYVRALSGNAVISIILFEATI